MRERWFCRHTEPAEFSEDGSCGKADGSQAGGVGIEVENNERRAATSFMDEFGLADEPRSEADGGAAREAMKGCDQAGDQEDEMDEVLGARPREIAHLLERIGLFDEAEVFLDGPPGQIALQDKENLLGGIGGLGGEQSHGLGVFAGQIDAEPQGPAIFLKPIELNAN